MPTCMYVWLHICTYCIYLAFYLSIWPLIDLPIYLFVSLALAVCLSISLAIYLPVSLSLSVFQPSYLTKYQKINR